MRFYIETYGCTANQGNSDEFASALKEMGHVPSSLKDADVVVVNTCVVTDRTERNMVKRLCQLQGKRLIVAGCLPVAMPEAVRDIKCRDIIGILSKETGREMGRSYDKPPVGAEVRLTKTDVETISDSARNGFECTGPGRGVPKCNVPARNVPEHNVPARSVPERNGSAYSGHACNAPARNLCAVVNISEGCKGNCSYCIVKKARGSLKSSPPEDVTDAVRRRIEEGAVEIQLASQDASAYGMDIGSNLPELLDMITEIPGRYMVRVGMMNPSTLEPILDDLIRSYKSPNIYKFVHLPIQSGSDSVLKRMNRFYKAEDFARIAARLRRGIPDLTLHTDVIAGFPGETEDDFKATKDLMRSVLPDKVNVTRFSSRPHTEASQFKELPSAAKKSRSRDLTRLWQEIAASRNERYVGKVVSVLVTEEGKGNTVKARTQNYREVVIDEKLPLGSSWDVKVAKANSFYLRATILNGE